MACRVADPPPTSRRRQVRRRLPCGTPSRRRRCAGVGVLPTYRGLLAPSFRLRCRSRALTSQSAIPRCSRAAIVAGPAACLQSSCVRVCPCPPPASTTVQLNGMEPPGLRSARRSVTRAHRSPRSCCVKAASLAPPARAHRPTHRERGGLRVGCACQPWGAASRHAARCGRAQVARCARCAPTATCCTPAACCCRSAGFGPAAARTRGSDRPHRGIHVSAFAPSHHSKHDRVAQLDRVSDYGSGGSRFESWLGHSFWGVDTLFLSLPFFCFVLVLHLLRNDRALFATFHHFGSFLGLRGPPSATSMYLLLFLLVPLDSSHSSVSTHHLFDHFGEFVILHNLAP
jgi:hypothetical protein